MESYCKKFLVLFFMLLTGAAVIAQVRIEHAEHVQGTLKRDGNSYTFIRKFNVLTAAKASSLSNTANKMVDVICGSPQFHPPMGFDAKVNVVGSDLGLKEDPPHLKVFCYLRYLVKDSRTNAIKESMDGTDLEITKDGHYTYDGFDKPSEGTYKIAEKGNLLFSSGYFDGGKAEKIDRPNKFFLVFPTIPGNRWTCGYVDK